MLVTPAGMTTELTQLDPLVTTPSVIVKFGVEFDASPVVHRYIPSGGAAACAGLTTSTDTAIARVVISKANLRILEVAFSQPREVGPFTP